MWTQSVHESRDLWRRVWKSSIKVEYEWQKVTREREREDKSYNEMKEVSNSCDTDKSSDTVLPLPGMPFPWQDGVSVMMNFIMNSLADSLSLTLFPESLPSLNALSFCSFFLIRECTKNIAHVEQHPEYVEFCTSWTTLRGMSLPSSCILYIIVIAIRKWPFQQNTFHKNTHEITNDGTKIETSPEQSGNKSN